METFEAELPNHCWQADVTHWQLENHGEVEFLDVIDDHSHLAIASLNASGLRCVAVVRASLPGKYPRVGCVQSTLPS